MSEENGWTGVQVIEYGHGIVDEIVAGILLSRPARLAGAAIVVGDDQVIAGKFRDLEGVPDVAGAGGFTEKQKRDSPAVSFVENIGVDARYERHRLD